MNAFDEMIAKYGLDPELFHLQIQKPETTQPLPVVVEAPEVDTLSDPPPVPEDVAKALATIPDQPPFMSDPRYGSDEGQSEAIGQPDPSWPQPFRTDPSGKQQAEFEDDDLGDLGPPF